MMCGTAGYYAVSFKGNLIDNLVETDLEKFVNKMSLYWAILDHYQGIAWTCMDWNCMD